MKIGVCSLTIGDEYKEITKYGRLSKVHYCEQHGYDFFDEDDIHDTSRPIPWSKIKLIQKHLDNYDYMVWLDGDTIIMNFEKKLETFIETHMQDKDFLCCKDSGLIINTGVFFIKNTDYAKNMLQSVYDQEQFINERFWEQASFIDLYNRNVDDLPDHCVVLTPDLQNEFNCSMYRYKNGDFIIHFLGIMQHEHLSRVMNDHYLLKRDEEDDVWYAHRVRWITEKYNRELNSL